MKPFDYQPRTRVVFGVGRLEELGTLALEFGPRRALVVSDPGVVAAGHTARGAAALDRAGIEVTVFDAVHQNPTTADVEAGLAVARKSRPELLVGLGGGSSMDCAKGINFLYSCGGSMRDYWGVGKATGPLLPMIAVPTTAGTGSEAQSFALISDAETHVKMACGDKRAACRIALLDPELTLTQPARITALTGVDALSHALETYVTKPRNALSQAFSREAWRLLAPAFPRVLADPNDLEARAAMQLGACLAGMAIENSMLGAAHALANPLTAVYDVVHGQAVALMLPHVIRFNGQDCWTSYAELLPALGTESAAAEPRSAPAVLADLVADYCRRAGLATRLAECGVERHRLPELAAQAAQQWTAGFNPRTVGVEELLALYEQAY